MQDPKTPARLIVAGGTIDHNRTVCSKIFVMHANTILPGENGVEAADRAVLTDGSLSQRTPLCCTHPTFKILKSLKAHVASAVKASWDVVGLQGTGKHSKHVQELACWWNSKVCWRHKMAISASERKHDPSLEPIARFELYDRHNSVDYWR
jgi:hypothetical protein